MDWKQFIASLIENLSWPVSVFAMFFLFRSEIGKLIQKLAHLKYKDLELDFEKVKQQAEAIHGVTEERVSLPIQDGNLYASLENQILDTLEKAPVAAILLAWSTLETAIASAVSRMAISPESPSYRSPLHNIEMLEKHADLPKGHVSLLNEMRILRNKVAHQHDAIISVSQEHARNYANTAIEMTHFLNQMKRNG